MQHYIYFIMKKTIFFIAITCLYSCNVIVKQIYKIKKPKYESLESQINFLIKNNLDTSNLYYFDDKFKTKLISGGYPMYASDTSDFKPIQTRFFNANGEPLSNWASCYGSVDNILNKDSIQPLLPGIVEHIILDTFMQNITPYKQYIRPLEVYEIYVVSIWAEYLGTPSTERLRKIDKLCEENPNRYIHLKINLGEL
jgi:hypothetical protein